jgi:hypothetical protein
VKAQTRESIAVFMQWYMENRRAVWACIAIFSVLGALAWAARYEYVTAARGNFYRINRWTGSIQFCRSDTCEPVLEIVGSIPIPRNSPTK